MENAICSSSTAAALDLRLNQRYKSWLDHLNNADSDILMKEQPEWLRKRDVICRDDPETFDGLEILHRARMLELGQFKHFAPMSFTAALSARVQRRSLPISYQTLWSRMRESHWLCCNRS